MDEAWLRCTAERALRTGRAVKERKTGCLAPVSSYGAVLGMSHATKRSISTPSRDAGCVRIDRNRLPTFPTDQRRCRYEVPTRTPYAGKCNHHNPGGWQGADSTRLRSHRPIARPLDSSAVAGSGESAAETLHRIDEELVRKEVDRAGFRFDFASDFLRNSDDDRTWNSSPRQAGARRGTSDRFAIKFVKPN